MMKYKDRVITTVAFERRDLHLYREAATAARLDFSAWVNALCARAVKRDRRVIDKRNNKGE